MTRCVPSPDVVCSASAGHVTFLMALGVMLAIIALVGVLGYAACKAAR